MKSASEHWKQCLNDLPLVAILRGVTPEDVLSVGQVLLDTGFKIVEVPLNSPHPFASISKLKNRFGSDLLIGAGTVLNGDDVNKTVEAGGRLIVAPNFNQAVAAEAVQSSCVYCPGVATPTEAFNAIDSGATALKLFPAEMITPAVVKAMSAVLPLRINMLAVGGITPDNMQTYLEAGCAGFGIGSALYKPGKSLVEIEYSAKRFVNAFEDVRV